MCVCRTSSVLGIRFWCDTSLRTITCTQRPRVAAGGPRAHHNAAPKPRRNTDPARLFGVHTAPPPARRAASRAHVAGGGDDAAVGRRPARAAVAGAEREVILLAHPPLPAERSLPSHRAARRRAPRDSAGSSIQLQELLNKRKSMSSVQGMPGSAVSSNCRHERRTGAGQAGAASPCLGGWRAGVHLLSRATSHGPPAMSQRQAHLAFSTWCPFPNNRACRHGR